jgi:hypothetical protein
MRTHPPVGVTCDGFSQCMTGKVTPSYSELIRNGPNNSGGAVLSISVYKTLCDPWMKGTAA